MERKKPWSAQTTWPRTRALTLTGAPSAARGARRGIDLLERGPKTGCEQGMRVRVASGSFSGPRGWYDFVFDARVTHGVSLTAGPMEKGWGLVICGGETVCPPLPLPPSASPAEEARGAEVEAEAHALPSCALPLCALLPALALPLPLLLLRHESSLTLERAVKFISAHACHALYESVAYIVAW